MTTTRDEIDRILELPTKFFVDIGASDCPGESQTEILIDKGWSGIMFECNPAKYDGLSKRMAGKSVTVIPDKVTPDNIVAHLRSCNAPLDFFLSLDIDGYDYFVLKAILEEYSPALIISEINEKIAPPIKFTVLYTPDYWWNGDHFYGYSIAMLEDLLPQHGYKIDDLHYNNVIISPGEQETSIEDIYNNGYFARPDGWKRFNYNEDFNPMYLLPYSEQEAFIRQKFANYEGQYMIDWKIHIQNSGQIQMSQSFGQWIAKYAADTRFQRYLEIGTWNGRGSPCCFYDGFSKRTDRPVFQSYEINKERCAEATSLWKAYPQFKIIHGRVLKDHECPMYPEVLREFPNANPNWHAEDVRNFWNCSYVAPEDPEVILLDGAEYLTQFEFDRVFKECPTVRVYMLDDTCTAKTPLINTYLLNHPEWTRVAYSDIERNGWAIFERITCSSEQTPESPDDLEE